MLAGKSGGDAAKLEAPLETHGTEEEDFKHQLAGSSNRGSLSFHCSVVYVSHQASSYEGKERGGPKMHNEDMPGLGMKQVALWYWLTEKLSHH